jgi:hypothetical protein
VCARLCRYTGGTAATRSPRGLTATTLRLARSKARRLWETILDELFAKTQARWAAMEPGQAFHSGSDDPITRTKILTRQMVHARLTTAPIAG